MSSNSDTNGRFHTDWLNMMYPRLMVSRNLLADDGVIFISIDDKEQNNLKSLCDEIFGGANFIANLIWQSTGGSNTGENIVTVTEYILVYAKNKQFFKVRLLEKQDNYNMKDEYFDTRGKYYLQKLDGKFTKNHFSESLVYPILLPNGKEIWPGGKSTRSTDLWNWRWSQSKVEWGIKNGFIEFVNEKESTVVKFKNYKKVDNNGNPRVPSVPPKNFIPSSLATTANGTKDLNLLFEYSIFDFPKPVALIEHLINLHKKDDLLILDFFSGSATTAHAIMKLNTICKGKKSFILVQLPEIVNSTNYVGTICDFAKTRIDRAGEQIKEEWIKENKGEGLFEEEKAFPYDIGFKVFKLDSTNIKAWDNDKELDETTLFDYSEVFKEGRSKEDIVYEIMLKYGVFDMQMKEVEVNGKTMYRIGKRYMIVCLEDEVTKEDIEAIADLRVKNVVFKESGFKNDNDKINAVHNLMKAGVEDIKCI